MREVHFDVTFALMNKFVKMHLYRSDQVSFVESPSLHEVVFVRQSGVGDSRIVRVYGKAGAVGGKCGHWVTHGSQTLREEKKPQIMFWTLVLL
jgi:hypothetical protein